MGIIVLAIVMLFLTNKFFDLKNLLNPFVFFYLYQTVFCFIALSYYEIYNISISSELQSYIVIAYLLTFLGGFTSRFLFSKWNIKYVRYDELSIRRNPSNSYLVSGFIILILAVILFLYFTYQTGGVIIFLDEVENSRIERRKGLGMINVIFITFFLYSFLILILEKKLSKGLKILIFLFISFALLSFGSRAPFIKFILAIFLLVGILSTKKHSLKKYFVVGVLSLSIIIVLGALRANISDNVDLLKVIKLRAGWRPFVNIQNLQRIFDFFPEKHNFMYGKTYLIDLGIFLPGHNPNFGTYLKDIMNWRFEGGSVTPTFLGIGYINFGKGAFYFYPFIIGFVFNSIYQLICNNNVVNISKIIFLILFSIGISGALSTGIMAALISNTMFLVFTLLLHYGIKQIFQKNIKIVKMD